MDLSKKTKSNLIAEVKRLQQQIKLLKTKISTTPLNKTQPSTLLNTQQWDLFYKHSDNFIYILNRKGIILDINKVNKEFNKNKIIGNSAYNFVVKKSQKGMKQAISSVFKTGKAKNYSAEHIDITGKRFYYKSKVLPIVKNKKVIAVIVDSLDITNEVSAQNEFKLSEEKFRKLSDAAFEGIVIHQAGKVVVVNKALGKIFNYSEKELIGQPIFKFIHKDFHEFAIEKLKNKEENPYEMIMLKKGNKPFWAKLMAREIIHEGAPARVVAIRDISTRKENERKIKESEERFKILSNATFEGIVFSDNGKVIDANDQFLKMYGYNSVQELLGKHIINDFIVPTQRNEAKKLIRLSASGLFEVETYRKDKSIISVMSKGQNIPYFGKNIRATVVYNISERKQYEVRLMESERTLSVLMNNLPGMAYRCNNDENWTMQFVSNGCKELTGYPPKALINNQKKSFASIVHPEDKDLGKEEIKIALKTKTPFEIEYRIITKKGEIKWVWEKGEGVFAEDGSLLFLEGFITDINDKKQYELEITQSRENYKSLIDYSPDGVVIHVDGNIKFANPSALNIVGVSSFKELEHVSAFEYILPEYHQQTIERLKKTKAGEKLDFIEIKIKNKKGEIKTLETKPILIKYNGKEAIQVVFHDVTAQKQLLEEQLRSQIAEEANKKLQQEIIERKNAEQELKLSEEKYRDLFENVTDFIQSIDVDGTIIYVNKAWKKALKYDDEKIEGKNIFDFIHPTCIDHCKMLFKEIINGNNQESIEVVFLTKDGLPIICDGNVSCKYENGKVISTRGVFRDVTERNKVAKKLKEQSAKHTSIIENSSHVIWTVDRNYCITSFNKNFDDHMKTRYGISAYIGLSMISGDTVTTQEYNDFWMSKYNGVLNGVPQYFETKLIDKFGEDVWREIYLNPIFDDAGNVVEFSGIAHDITEKKLANEKLQQSLEEKDILLKEVHHRVKNNLQVISSILNLQSSYIKDPQILNILKESQNRIKSMAFIHESLYQTKDLTGINFSEYITSLTHNLIHSYSNLDHEVRLTLDIEPVFLNLDLAIPCGLIINEIVSNALKYAFNNNHLYPEISIKMQSEGENLTLIIGDNGIGLPQHINFRNTESLGLQLVVTLTDQLNGKINIDTKKGTFYTIVFKHNQVNSRI